MAKSTRKAKSVAWIEPCLAVPPPENASVRPPLEVQRLVNELATLPPELRVRVVPVAVRWYGWAFPWPVLSAAEADSFAQTTSWRIAPGDRTFLFGEAIATTPGDLETFRRCLSIAASWHTLQNERLEIRGLRAAIPVMPAGPEEERIVRVFLDVPLAQSCGAFLRETIVAFLFQNERWHVFDELIAGFADARGAARESDLALGFFPEHAARIEAIRARWLEANTRGLERMKPVWEAQRDVESLAHARFVSHATVKKTLGNKLVFVGLPVASNRDPSSIVMTFDVARSTGARERLGTLYIHATRVNREWSFEHLRFDGDEVVIDCRASD